MAKKLTTEEFIKRAREVHGDKYDYSKVEYNGTFGKVCIICHEHGEFCQSATVHLTGHGCPMCAIKKIKKNKDDFIKEVNKIHKDKLSVNEYLGRRKKIQVICNICGYKWKTRADVLLSGCGCPKCFYEKNKLTIEEFIKRAREVHGDKYDYSKVEYVDSNTKVCIICPEHGEFWQTPSNHLYLKQGCPKCVEYKLEKIVEKSLQQNNVKFERQKTFNWLKNKKSLRLDFYLPDYSIAIECQGRQHFESIEGWGGEETYNYVRQNDIIKNKLCEQHNIKIIYYSNIENSNYKCFTKENELLKEIFNYGI